MCAISGLGSHHDLSDYYFRDSFEHSSSESGFTNYYNETRTGPNRLHNSNSDSFATYQHHQPPHLAAGQQRQSQKQSASNTSSSAIVNQQNAINDAKNMKKFSILHAFIPSFFLVVLIFCLATIFILESEADFLTSFKNLPEMVNLKYQYYQPLKDFIYRMLGLK